MRQRIRDNIRYRNLVSIILLLMLILAVRLFVVTMIQHDRWEGEAAYQSTKTLYNSAPRGNIYDRNGVLLAGNRQVFSVKFNASNLSSKEINETVLTTINKLVENKDTYNDDFPIFMRGGTFTYTYDKNMIQWLVRNGYNSTTTAEQVFNMTRAEYDIKPELDRYAAMEELQTKHNVTLPINVRNMRFTYEIYKSNFWSKFGFESEDGKEITPEECFRKLRVYYGIDESLSDEDARKIMVVRNKITEGSFQRYLPITIATDISDLSVIYFNEMNLPGITVTQDTERYYPYGSLASHIIGYMGAISDEEAGYYLNDNYLVTDLVGKAGIEQALESQLHGTPGIETIVVNSDGEYVSTLEKQETKKGSDVYLTIDVELQEKIEDTLERGIYRSVHAKQGAAVLLDVKTADVIAMASYPDFDLNMFADGISEEEWASVQPENPRDAFSPTPLYNNATMASAAPGSTFKPITALTALSCGLDPNMHIEDGGYIEIAGKEFGCSLWNDVKATHGFENLQWGIGNSCNYYFACIATGKNWNSGKDLGYHTEITIDDILKKARAYGLGSATGIEIYETVRPAVSIETKMESYRAAVWEALYDRSREFLSPEVYNDSGRLTDNITKISNWIYENPEFGELMDLMLRETDVMEDQIEACATMVKFDYFNQAEWTTYDVFNVSIGQGDNNYTPVQMANFIATLGNEGFRNQVSVVYGIEGLGKTVKAQPVDTNTKNEEIKNVIAGMELVCTGGTLKDHLSDYPIAVAGKTGTAEYQAIKQPADEMQFIKEHLDILNAEAGTKITWKQVERKVKELMKTDATAYPDENETVDQAIRELSDHLITQGLIDKYKDRYEDFSWIVTLAPADNPQVAIAIMLPEGGTASDNGQLMKELLDDYFGYSGEKKDPVHYVATDNDGSNVIQ